MEGTVSAPIQRLTPLQPPLIGRRGVYADIARVRMIRHSAQSAVFEDVDLLGTIMAHATLTPERLIGMARVGKAWHAAVYSDGALLLSVARRPRFLTKSTFCGLFALSRREADAFPRCAMPRSRGGFMYMYSGSTMDAVLTSMDGVDGWRRRVALRAKYQASVEQTFGPDWRELNQLRWGPAA
jgi:hypothetical protein